MLLTFNQLRELRIEHDQINGLPTGTLSVEQSKRLRELREKLMGTEFAPWSDTQTKKAYESIYGEGSW